MTSAVRIQRMSNQTIESYSSQPQTTYRIQIFIPKTKSWRTLDAHYATGSKARAAALDGRTSPVQSHLEWRIIRSVRSYDVVTGDED